MELNQLVQQLDQAVESAVNELKKIDEINELLQFKNKILGKQGPLQEVMRHLRNLPNEAKKELGQASNRAKRSVEEVFETQAQKLRDQALKAKLQAESIDVTLPGKRRRQAFGHPLRQVEQELTTLFRSLHFEVADGPEIEEDFYNFEALNFPHDHPARDAQDTFLTDDGRLLRTHTSPVQVRTLLNYEPPIRIIAAGRVYRCDNDVTHSPVFHQIEGLYVDKNVTFQDLKGLLEVFVQRYFGPNTPIRMRASFFPFTEPSAEVDIGCVFCKQSGCRICSQTGWLEILGSGMVDPEVLRKANVDPSVYSGFAFGLGIERIAMLKYAISDIRFFYDGSISFLRQF